MPDYQRYESETKCPLFDSPLSVTAYTARMSIIIHKQNSPEHHITVIQAIRIVLCHKQFPFFFCNSLAQPFFVPGADAHIPTNTCGEKNEANTCSHSYAELSQLQHPCASLQKRSFPGVAVSLGLTGSQLPPLFLANPVLMRHQHQR